MKTVEELKKRAERIIPDAQLTTQVKRIRYSFDERELQEYTEAYHKERVNRVTDEEIEKLADDYGDAAIKYNLPDYGLKGNASLDFSTGAKWFKSKLMEE